MYVVDRQTMLSAERLTEEKGTPLYTLMLNAGNAAADYIIKNCDITGKRLLILCGKGNNGGDGFVMARRLSLYAEVTVATLFGEPASTLAQKAFLDMGELIKVIGIEEAIIKSKEFDVIIDAIFGTGYNGEKPEGKLRELFSAVQKTAFAVDIPSGLECDTGRGFDTALKTDCTITFGAKKLCQVLPYSADVCGKVICLDIGIDEETLSSSGANIKENERPTFESRPKTCHKNTFGTALAVTGSYGMPGAAILSAKAAVKSGVGILKVATLKENYTALAASVPEAVLVPYKSGKVKPIEAQLKTASALLIGCGLSVDKKTEKTVKTLLEKTEVPTVLDADGINIVAKSIELLRKVKAPIVLTPHPAEMARLLGTDVKTVEANRFKIASDFSAQYGVYLILKGANTIIAAPDGRLAVNTNGNAGMAKAGSGDMLSGIITALLANGTEPFKAASSAVWLHAAAGDSAKKLYGERAMLPSDMIEQLSGFF